MKVVTDMAKDQVTAWDCWQIAAELAARLDAQNKLLKRIAVALEEKRDG